MKFLTLGYMAEETWESMSKADQDAIVEECHEYDETLIKNGHWLEGGYALQNSKTAKTL